VAGPDRSAGTSPLSAWADPFRRLSLHQHVRHGEKLYTYPRYNFSNASADIRKLFCDACDLLGIEWRVMNARNISVARRASVARLDEFVGPKR
jgi:hypothetical protein